MSDEGFISRWSRRKSASKAAPEAGPDRPVADAIPAMAGTHSAAPMVPQAPASPPPAEPLPPVESLTLESDFTPFMKPEVDADTRRKAVKMLFRDPRFNVMDGLDVYIDDYSKPDPLPDGWLEQMTQMARLGEYRDPDEEAARDKAREEAPVLGEIPQKPAQEQPLANPARESAADTPDAGSQPARVKESPPSGEVADCLTDVNSPHNKA